MACHKLYIFVIGIIFLRDENVDWSAEKKKNSLLISAEKRPGVRVASNRRMRLRISLILEVTI